MLWYLIPQFLAAGITNGAIYALVALGYCLVQNATGMVNFAQGEFVMIGAMTALTMLTVFHLPFLPSFVISILVCTTVALALQLGPIRHSKNREILILVMITVGASISLRGAGMLIWGKSSHIYPPLGSETPILFLNAAVLPQSLWILAISTIALTLLYLFFHATLVGKAMRAAADNNSGAVLIGIPVGKLISLSFALSGAFGALAGVLVTPITGMSYDAGLMIGIKGFAAAVLGGYGSAAGAVIGGILLGVLESLGAGLISSAYKDAIAFVLLLAVLFVRPAGLLGSIRVRRL